MDDGLDTIKVATLVSPPHEDQPLGDVCAGCAELTQRIEELERRLARVETSSTSTFMSAWTCYWSCVGFHALLVFVSFQSDSWESFGYSFLVSHF